MSFLFWEGFWYYSSTPHICLPSHINPLYIFNRSSCTGTFILQIGPPNHSHATKIATWFFVETPTLLSSWWSGNARTKPASTEQLRNLPTITSVSASGVNAIAHWKGKPAECLGNATVILLHVAYWVYWLHDYACKHILDEYVDPQPTKSLDWITCT